jgi:DNA-directed RNA polymerase specialized sigma24 family protein
VAHDSAPDHGRFPTTKGSFVRGVLSGDPALRERSWEALAHAYWKPAYKHVRVRWRLAEEDAEDAIQGFFARALEADFFASYEPGRARFRTFFRVCLDRWVANERKARARQKRGGGAVVLGMDFAAAERELALAGAAAWESPEACFDREWKRSLFARAIEGLRVACEESGKGVHYAIFAAYDLCEVTARPTYEDLARAHGVPVTTVTNQLAFARRELRRLVLEELARVTENDTELTREAREVLGAPGGRP